MVSDYFDHVERELTAAMRRGYDLPWYARLRLRRRPGLAVVIAAAVLAAPAAALVGLLQGSPVPSNAQYGPGNGYATASGVAVPVIAADPGGGLPWAIRLTHTSQREVCVQLGRVESGVVGELGVNGAFHNDGRFHPYSPNFVNGPPYCAIPDGAGHAFVNIQEWHVSVSGLSNYVGCQANPACPSGNLSNYRNVYYGLLGPDAASVSYRTTDGAIATKQTAGPDGAYLLVTADASPSYGVTSAWDVDLDLLRAPYPTQPIVGVTYRDGHTCRLDGAHPACRPVGAVLPKPPSARQVAAPVSARIGAGGSIVVSFTARVAATNSHYYYRALLCGGASYTVGRLTKSSPIGPQPDTPAGARVVAHTGTVADLRAGGCNGPVRGRVVLVTDGPDIILGGDGTRVSRTVGTFSLDVR
jgi:hypothetical protein